ncbi:MAG: tape measure protein [Acholeplasmataceae bacterium]|nr:tape measure protein [Acholeplasmataceae bacterium]
MATIASLLVKIGADTGDLRKELNATKRQIKTAFGSEFINVSSKAGTALTGIGVALAGLSVAAVKTASEFQNTQIALTNMLGSAEKAESFIKEMQSFAAKTPFSFSDVTQAAQKFLAFGFTVEQVIPTLTAVGDAAAGVGAGQDGVNRLTVALGQIAAKGKLASQEMMQITELGIPAWKMLADAMGISIAEVQDQVSKGAVDSQTALEALVSGMETKYSGLMDQQSKGIGGAWSAMLDGLEQSAAQTGLRISDALKLPELFTGLGNSLSAFAAEVQNSGFSEAFRNAIPPGFQLAIVGIGTALTMVAIPAISLATASLVAFAAPLIAAIAAFAPFILGVTAVVTGLYALWQSGITAADVISFLGVNTKTLGNVWDTLKGTVQSLGNVIATVFEAAKPVFTTFLAVGSLAFLGVGKLVGYLINVFSVFATIILSAIQWVADGISAWYSFVGDTINGLGDIFLQMSNSVLPEWANNGLKSISGFVDKAVSWLNKLLGKVEETNSALGSSDNTKKETPKTETKKWAAPSFTQFGTMDAPDSSDKTSRAAEDKLATQAENTSKSIADAWYQTFATKSALIDRWYSEELAELDKSANANENYERDKQRLSELYGQKRLEALQQEAKKALEIQNSARDISFNIRGNTMNLDGDAAAQAQKQMLLDYEKGIAAVDDRWAQLSQNYLGYTAQEKDAFLNALNERGIAYTVNANNELEFEKQKNAEKLALAKNYYDQVAEYHANCTDIKKQIDEAYRTYDMERLQEVLTEEAAIRLNDMEAQKSMMDVYQQAFLAAHQTTAQLVADMYSTAFSGLSNAFASILSGSKSAKAAFKDLGKAMIQTIAQFYAQKLAGMLISDAMAKKFGKKQTADSVARAATELSAWTPVAVAYATVHPGAAAQALKDVGLALTGAVTLATGISSAFSKGFGAGSNENETGNDNSYFESRSRLAGIPQYASGGYFTRPLLGVLGDGSEPEVALPLSKAVFNNIAAGIVDTGKISGESGNIVATQNLYGDINNAADVEDVYNEFGKMIVAARRGG